MAVVVIDGGTTNTRIMLVQDGKVIGRASGPVGVRDSALDGNNARLKAGMDFRKLPKSHLKIVKRWLGFYQAYKEEIVRGRWQPLEFDPHTSTFAIYGNRTTFVGLFKDVLGRIVLDEGSRDALTHVYLFNGTNTSYVHTRLEPMEGVYELAVFDPFVEEVGRSKVEDVNSGLSLSLTVPEGGMVEVVRLE